MMWKRDVGFCDMITEYDRIARVACMFKIPNICISQPYTIYILFFTQL